MSNLVSNMFNPNAAGASAGAPAPAATPEVETPNPTIPGMPPMGGGFDSIFQS